MNRFGALLLAAALSVSASYAAEDCAPLKVLASVDMVPLKSGRIAVPVTVGGQPTYFILATAVPMSSIREQIVAQNHYTSEHSAVKFVDLAGNTSDKLAVVPSFGLGRLSTGSTSLVMTEGNGLPLPDGSVTAGVLGADFLRGYDVDLDFGGNKLNLISRDRCDVDPVYWKSATMAKLPMTVTDKNKISFVMELDGHRLDTVLNTGVPMSTLNLRVARAVFDIDNDSPGNRPEGRLNKDTPLFSHRFQSLSAGDLKIENPRLVLLPPLADQKIRHLEFVTAVHFMPINQQPDLVLGMAELRHLHLYIDYHHQTLYMTPATPGGDMPGKSPN